MFISFTQTPMNQWAEEWKKFAVENSYGQLHSLPVGLYQPNPLGSEQLYAEVIQLADKAEENEPILVLISSDDEAFARKCQDMLLDGDVDVNVTIPMHVF